MSKERKNKYNQEMEKWRRLKQPRYITGLAGLTEEELPAYRPDMAYIKARSPDAFKENAYTFSQGKRVPLKGSPALFPFADQNTIFKSPNQIAQMPNGMDAFPQSKYIDPRFATPEELESFFNVSEIQELQNNPEWLKQNAEEIGVWAGLRDRSLTALARLFNYDDEADLELLGMDVGGIESVWDGALKRIVGGYDLLNVGLTGLISAMPGGIETLSYEELTGGGMPVSDILMGQLALQENAAPSMGQAILASIGKEMGRMKRGDLRVADLLLLNPATAPFFAAAFLAEDSPLQDRDFDITDPQDRLEAFSQGPEKFFSGLTDVGLMFADPLIGVGVGLKFARAGALGTLMTKGGKAKMNEAYDQNMMAKIEEVFGADPDSEMAVIVRDANVEFEALQGEGPAVSRIESLLNQFKSDDPAEAQRLSALYQDFVETLRNNANVEKADPLTRFIFQIAARNAPDAEFRPGQKSMLREEIVERLEFKGNPNMKEVGLQIQDMDDPIRIMLTLKGEMGDARSLDLLKQLNALQATNMEVIAKSVTLLSKLVGIEDPMIKNFLETTQAKLGVKADRLRGELEDAQAALDEAENAAVLMGDAPGAAPPNLVELSKRYDTAQAELEQVESIMQVMIDGDTGELAAMSMEGLRLTDPAMAQEVVEQLLRRETPTGATAEELLREVRENVVAMGDEQAATQRLLARQNSGAGNTKTEYYGNIPYKNNAYSRMVGRSRERRARAAAEYKAEGTSILPRRGVEGQEGWFSASIFPGTSRFDRSVRIWRWAGVETPVGWIGLKGMSQIGVDREIKAMLRDVKAFKSAEGIEVAERLRSELITAIMDPFQDSLKAVKRFETQVTNYIADFYGLTDFEGSEKLIRDILRKAQGQRDKIMKDTARKVDEGDSFFTDEYGDINYAPWLEVHGANGVMVTNFSAFERGARKTVAKPQNLSNWAAAAKFGGMMTTDTVKLGTRYFNNFWRPATLLRASYTQRNVFEGMLRAMAYTHSLQPLLWPAQASYDGIVNKLGVKPRRAKKAADKARERLKEATLTPQSEVDAPRYADLQRQADALQRQIDAPEQQISSEMTIALVGSKNLPQDVGPPQGGVFPPEQMPADAVDITQNRDLYPPQGLPDELPDDTEEWVQGYKAWLRSQNLDLEEYYTKNLTGNPLQARGVMEVAQEQFEASAARAAQSTSPDELLVTMGRVRIPQNFDTLESPGGSVMIDMGKGKKKKLQLQRRGPVKPGTEVDLAELAYYKLYTDYRYAKSLGIDPAVVVGAEREGTNAILAQIAKQIGYRMTYITARGGDEVARDDEIISKATHVFGIQGRNKEGLPTSGVTRAMDNADSGDATTQLFRYNGPDTDLQVFENGSTIENITGHVLTQPRGLTGNPRETAIAVKMTTLPDGSQRFYTTEDLNAQKAAVDAELDKMQTTMEVTFENARKAVEGTKFGDWWEQNIRAMEAEQQVFAQNLQMLNAERGKWDPNDVVGRRILDMMVERTNLEAAKQRDKFVSLITDPERALQLYQAQAGRRRRIGSGTSKNADGNFYGDGFNGMYADLNTQMASSDMTTKQRLSLDFNTAQSLFLDTIRQNSKPRRWVSNDATSTKRVAEGLARNIDIYSSSPLVREMMRTWSPENGYNFKDVANWVKNTNEGRAWYLSARQMFDESDEGAQAAVDAQRQAVDKADELDKGRLKAPAPDFSVAGLRSSPIGTTADEFQQLVMSNINVDQGPLFAPQVVERFLVDIAERIDYAMWDMEGLRQIMIDESSIRGAGTVDTSRVATGRLDSRTELGTLATQVEEFLTALPDEVKDYLGPRADLGADTLPVPEAFYDLTTRARDTYQARPYWVMTDEVLKASTENFGSLYAKFTNAAFRVLGTVPEDYVVRMPFYNRQYKAIRDRLIREYWDDNYIPSDGDLKLMGIDRATWNARKKRRDKLVGKAPKSGDGNTITIPLKNLRAIEVAAHKQAISDVREWMYTIERRTNLGKYGEYFLPFISATQNSVTVLGKLLNRDPWLGPFAVDVWRAPEKLGIEDEEGNIVIPVAFNWGPFAGKALDENSLIRASKAAFNVFSPETGFGFIPRMGPMQLVPASEAMKIGMLPVQTPEVLVSVMGQKAADDLYGTFQDWLFGEQGSFSEQPFSWDLIIPAWAQKQVSNMDKMSRAWGTKFTVLYAREMNKFNSGQREFAPTTEELTKMVSNSFWFDTLGNLGVPTPQTPYPILTRPGVYNGEMDIPRLIRGYIDKEKEDPTFDAGTAFQDNFGYYFSSFGNMRGTVNTGGIAPQNIAVADATRFNELIGDIAGEIAEEHLGVLGIITNNRIEQGDYDRNAATWQKVNRVPGKGIKWKEDLSAEERILEGERIAGWVYYRSRMDALEAELFARGLSSFQQVEARDLKVKKDLMIEDMEDRPFMRGWVIDYQDAGGGKTKAAVQTIRMALADPDFEKFMIDNNMDKTLSAMQQYVTARNYFGNAILELNAAAPNSDKYKQEKLQLKLQWLMKKDQLRMYDERWAEIEDLYLSADEDPAVETALNSKLLREELQGG